MEVDEFDIKTVISNASPLLVVGSGILTAQALMAAGQPAASMAVIEPVSGRLDQTKTPEQIMTVLDPRLHLEKSASPQNTMTLQSPSFSGPAR